MQSISEKQISQKHKWREMFADFCLLLHDAKGNAVKDAVDYHAIHKDITSFIKMAVENKTSLDADYTDVIYMMAALADDVFLNMNWSGKQFWDDNILEQYFFHSQIAGEEIFVRMQKMFSEKNDASLDKAECYLKMIIFGFQGKYRGVDDQERQIDLHRNTLVEFIEKQDASMLSVGLRIFQKEYACTIPTIHRTLLPDASIVNYVCAFFVIMFLAVSSIVWMWETKDISRLLVEISSMILKE